MSLLFSHAIIISLRRRPDRLCALQDRLRRQGIAPVVMPAVDGRDLANDPLWLAYAASPLAQPPQETQVRSSRDFYLRNGNRAERLAYYEQKYQRKALSRGAWAYLLSYRNALLLARETRLDRFLLLDDDCLLHRDFGALLAGLQADLPRDWRAVALGALQYEWSEDWISWAGPRLYRCHGSSVGSHAMAYRGAVVDELLADLEEPDLPVDVGALHRLRRRRDRRCFVAWPNLMIQDTSDSEIGDSQVQGQEGRRRDNVYRWRLEDYS